MADYGYRKADTGKFRGGISFRYPVSAFRFSSRLSEDDLCRDGVVREVGFIEDV